MLYLSLLNVGTVVEAKTSKNKDIARIDDLIGAGKYDQALAESTALEKKIGKSAELIADRALAFMYKGDNKNAQSEAEGVLKIDSTNHEAHWVLANVLMSQGQGERAMQEYQLSTKYKSRKKCKPCLKTSEELIKKIKQAVPDAK